MKIESGFRSSAVAAVRLLRWLSVLLALALGTAYAQSGDTPVMRTTTRLVQLNVVVVDKQGHPVRGLPQDDFQVFDNDALRKIVHFSASSGGVDANQDVARSPLVISNRQAGGEESGGVTVILIDGIVLDARPGLPLEIPARIRMATLAVLDFLKTVKPGESVALYALRSDGIVVIHDFTEDSQALVTAAKSLQNDGNRGKRVLFGSLVSANGRSLREWRDAGGLQRNQQDQGFSEDAGALSGGFQGLMEHLQGMPGRKNLVWISSTFPSIVGDFSPARMGADRDAATPVPGAMLPVPDFSEPDLRFEQWRRFARLFSDANIAVYPMDAQGVDTMGVGYHYSGSGPVLRPDAPFGALGPLGPAMGNPEVNNTAVSPPSAPNSAGSLGQWAAMEMLADETGGRAVINSNAFDQHLQEIVAQTDASYQIGYHPGDKAWDGKYHKIQVKIARQGLTVLCRKGYYAKDEPVMQNWDLALREVARSPVEAPGIGVTLNVASNPLQSGPEDLVVKLDVHDIHFEQKEQRSNANLDVAFVQLSKDGRVLGGIKDRVALALLPETFGDAETQGWFYPRSLWIEPKTEKMRVVVRDLATGAVGSVSVPVVFEIKGSR